MNSHRLPAAEQGEQASSQRQHGNSAGHGLRLGDNVRIFIQARNDRKLPLSGPYASLGRRRRYGSGHDRAIGFSRRIRTPQTN
jgi:hypothetical protein